MDRRTLLRYAAVATTAGVAGCMGDGTDTTPTPTDEQTPTPTEDEDTPTPTDEQTPTPTDEQTPTPTEDEDTPTPTDEQTPTPTEDEDTPTPTDEQTPTPTEDEGPPMNPDQTIQVGDGDRLQFSPESFEISAGDTVLWEWAGSGHNIKYDDGGVPEGTDWEGTDGSRTTLYGEGHQHWHTFETTGKYCYYCVPHRGSGMRGEFTVG